MRRVVSLWLPRFATDRLRRRLGMAGDGMLVTTMPDQGQLVLAAVDAAAARAGLTPAMPLARARAMLAGLEVHPATPEADAAALRDLAAWCRRYAPLTAVDDSLDLVDGPDRVRPARRLHTPDHLVRRDHALWIDVTGSAHLFGGEARLLRDLTGRLAGQGLEARAAVADTPGVAWAMARFADAVTVVVPPGDGVSVLAGLPVAALRLPAAMVDGLRRLGLDRVGALLAAPRAPLARRFGSLLLLRLDQASGAVFEPIVPLVPPEVVQVRLAFAEPLLAAESLAAAIDRLAAALCRKLERMGHGARRLDLLFERMDGAVPALRVGTARASRAPAHLSRLLRERLERIDPGLGIEAMRLVASRTDPLERPVGMLPGPEGEAPDLAPLIDRLANRLGAARVHRIAPAGSRVPERSVRREAPLPARGAAAWPDGYPRPVRLLDVPQPVAIDPAPWEAVPQAFVWRRMRHRVRHADGPERIAGEWWRHDAECGLVRDYFRIEDEAGRRFWLFRSSDETATEDAAAWYLHGFF